MLFCYFCVSLEWHLLQVLSLTANFHGKKVYLRQPVGKSQLRKRTRGRPSLSALPSVVRVLMEVLPEEPQQLRWELFRLCYQSWVGGTSFHDKVRSLAKQFIFGQQNDMAGEGNASRSLLLLGGWAVGEAGGGMGNVIYSRETREM